jgi:sulfate adenylyltransferase subunit 2
MKIKSRHLQELESESIHILRETIAQFEKPVLLYSIGKDSSVLLHLTKKAFHPAPIPLPLMHIDTTWKFREMILFRDQIVKRYGAQLLVHINEEGRKANVNPNTSDSAHFTHVMKTEGLRQALEQHKFDAAIGGARRDEEKSRAKERVFSHRTADHRWDPKNQRPEIWRLYNGRLATGESMRIFPLSNWTELDVWQYIDAEEIPVVPLYFASERPVIVRAGAMIMVDDDRLQLSPGEVPELRRVRFRSLGCYPLTCAVESDAASIGEIIEELKHTRSSERQGRVIDRDQSSSMEKKKEEGYF